MRFILVAATSLTLLLAGTSTWAETDVSETASFVEADLEQQFDSNVVVCTAVPGGYRYWQGPQYEGYSFIFSPGSGQGQQAHRLAERRAREACAESTRQRCYVRECNVQRFSM